MYRTVQPLSFQPFNSIKMKKILFILLVITCFGNITTYGQVAYLNVLQQYEGRSRVPDLGPYTRSEREEHANGSVIFRFYNNRGWQKYVAFSNCYYCHGSGNCSGFHFGFCSICGNTGRCKYCGGEGTLISIAALGPNGYYSEDGAFHSTGSGGNGNGYSGSGGYSGSSSSRSSTYTTCTTCRGSGVCTGCNGRKGSWENTGYYTGSNTKSWINCGSCNGSGKCSICYGRGKL